MKKYTLFMIYAFIIISILAFSNCKKEIKAIKVAFVAPFDELAGIAMKNSVLMAKEQINSEGGISVKIDGKPVKLKIELEYVNDHFSDVTLATSSLRKAINEKGCRFIIGGYSSKVVNPLMEVMAENKIPWMGIGGASPKIVEKVEKNYNKYKYYFRVGTMDSILQAINGAEFVKNVLFPKGFKKAAFISVNHSYAKSIVSTAKKHLKASGIEVVMEEYTSIKSDFSKILDQVIEIKADFIYGVFLSKETYLFVDAVLEKKLNDKMPIIGSMSEIVTDKFPRGNDKVKWFTSIQPQGGPVDLTGDGTAIEFTKKYTQIYNAAPHWVSYPSYDALYVLKEGIEKSGSLKADDIIKTLEADNFEYSHIIRYKWYKKNHDLYIGKHNNKMYATFNWFQYFDDGKRYCVYPSEFKQKDFYFPKKSNAPQVETNKLNTK